MCRSAIKSVSEHLSRYLCPKVCMPPRPAWNRGYICSPTEDHNKTRCLIMFMWMLFLANEYCIKIILLTNNHKAAQHNKMLHSIWPLAKIVSKCNKKMIIFHKKCLLICLESAQWELVGTEKGKSIQDKSAQNLAKIYPLMCRNLYFISSLMGHSPNHPCQSQ